MLDNTIDKGASRSDRALRFAASGSRFRLINGDRAVSDQDSNMARVKEILGQIDDKNREQTAAVLLAILKRELGERRRTVGLVVVLSVIAACSVEAILFLLLLR